MKSGQEPHVCLFDVYHPRPGNDVRPAREAYKNKASSSQHTWISSISQGAVAASGEPLQGTALAQSEDVGCEGALPAQPSTTCSSFRLPLKRRFKEDRGALEMAAPSRPPQTSLPSPPSPLQPLRPSTTTSTATASLSSDGNTTASPATALSPPDLDAGVATAAASYQASQSYAVHLTYQEAPANGGGGGTGPETAAVAGCKAAAGEAASAAAAPAHAQAATVAEVRRLTPQPPHQPPIQAARESLLLQLFRQYQRQYEQRAPGSPPPPLPAPAPSPAATNTPSASSLSPPPSGPLTPAPAAANAPHATAAFAALTASAPVASAAVTAGGEPPPRPPPPPPPPRPPAPPLCRDSPSATPTEPVPSRGSSETMRSIRPRNRPLPVPLPGDARAPSLLPTAAASRTPAAAAPQLLNPQLRRPYSSPAGGGSHDLQLLGTRLPPAAPCDSVGGAGGSGRGGSIASVGSWYGSGVDGAIAATSAAAAATAAPQGLVQRVVVSGGGDGGGGGRCALPVSARPPITAGAPVRRPGATVPMHEGEVDGAVTITSVAATVYPFAGGGDRDRPGSAGPTCLRRQESSPSFVAPAAACPAPSSACASGRAAAGVGAAAGADAVAGVAPAAGDGAADVGKHACAAPAKLMVMGTGGSAGESIRGGVAYGVSAVAGSSTGGGFGIDGRGHCLGSDGGGIPVGGSFYITGGAGGNNGNGDGGCGHFKSPPPPPPLPPESVDLVPRAEGVAALCRDLMSRLERVQADRLRLTLLEAELRGELTRARRVLASLLAPLLGVQPSGAGGPEREPQHEQQQQQNHYHHRQQLQQQEDVVEEEQGKGPQPQPNLSLGLQQQQQQQQQQQRQQCTTGRRPACGVSPPPALPAVKQEAVSAAVIGFAVDLAAARAAAATAAAGAAAADTWCNKTPAAALGANTADAQTAQSLLIRLREAVTTHHQALSAPAAGAWQLAPPPLPPLPHSELVRALTATTGAAALVTATTPSPSSAAAEARKASSSVAAAAAQQVGPSAVAGARTNDIELHGTAQYAAEQRAEAAAAAATAAAGCGANDNASITRCGSSCAVAAAAEPLQQPQHQQRVQQSETSRVCLPQPQLQRQQQVVTASTWIPATPRTPAPPPSPPAPPPAASMTGGDTCTAAQVASLLAGMKPAEEASAMLSPAAAAAATQKRRQRGRQGYASAVQPQQNQQQRQRQQQQQRHDYHHHYHHHYHHQQQQQRQQVQPQWPWVPTGAQRSWPPPFAARLSPAVALHAAAPSVGGGVLLPQERGAPPPPQSSIAAADGWLQGPEAAGADDQPLSLIWKRPRLQQACTAASHRTQPTSRLDPALTGSGGH